MEEPEVITSDNKNNNGPSSPSAAAEEWAQKMNLFHQQILSVLASVDRKKVRPSLTNIFGT